MKKDFVFVPGWLTGCFQHAKQGIFYDCTKLGAAFFCITRQNSHFSSIDLQLAFAETVEKAIFATVIGRHCGERLCRPLRTWKSHNTVKLLKINPS